MDGGRWSGIGDRAVPNAARDRWVAESALPAVVSRSPSRGRSQRPHKMSHSDLMEQQVGQPTARWHGSGGYRSGKRMRAHAAIGPAIPGRLGESQSGRIGPCTFHGWVAGVHGRRNT